MSQEWPITAPPEEEKADTAAAAIPAGGERRLAGVMQDFLLPAANRLTEQERALMTLMLHGLVERIASELRAAVEPQASDGEAMSTAALVYDLAQAGLLADSELVALLLRRADSQRLMQAAAGRRTQLQRWTAGDDAEVASAAMALIAARGRGQDRFGRASLDLSDLPPSVRERLTHAIAALLAYRSSATTDEAWAEAASKLLASSPVGERLEELEVILADAMSPTVRRQGELLTTLLREGEAPVLAAILACEAGIPAGEAWHYLLGGGRLFALLLRMAGVERPVAAALFANAGAGLGIGDPVVALDEFDRLEGEVVDATRSALRTPPAYRRAKAGLAAHG